MQIFEIKIFVETNHTSFSLNLGFLERKRLACLLFFIVMMWWWWWGLKISVKYFFAELGKENKLLGLKYEKGGKNLFFHMGGGIIL